MNATSGKNPGGRPRNAEPSITFYRRVNETDREWFNLELERSGLRSSALFRKMRKAYERETYPDENQA